MPERIVRMSREVECLAGEGVTTACAERQYPPDALVGLDPKTGILPEQEWLTLVSFLPSFGVAALQPASLARYFSDSSLRSVVL